MALTDTDKAYLAEAIRIPHPDLVAAELAELTSAQEIILKADLARWQVIRGQYGSLNGHNASGVEFDPADERADIRNRIIRMLNCGRTVNDYRASQGGAAGSGRILRG